MYQVLVVDDEAHSVRGLQAGVRWNDLNIDNVHTAHSLRQAQEVFKTQPVHLMVCDIEMPQGSGLELLAWVRKEYPQTETVFLTCHSDFQFAKQAIQLGSFDYLLKPVDYAELEGVIGKALAKVSKNRELQTFEETYKHYQKLWESHRPLVTERFWQDLIRQTIPSSPGAIEEHLRNSGLPYSGDMRFLPIYVRIQKWHKTLSPRDARIMEYALRNAAEEGLLKYDRSSVVIPVQDAAMLAILPMASVSGKESLVAGCNSFIQACSRYFYCDLCCYIGKPVRLNEMVSMLGDLQKLDENNVTCINRTFAIEDIRKRESKMQPAPMSEWSELMKQGARARLIEDVNRYFENWMEEREGVGAGSLQHFYQDFLQMIYFVLQTKGLQANQVFAQNLLTNKPESVLRSIPALLEWARYVIEIAMNQIHSIEESLTVVDRVKRFITEQIGLQSLSREDIASHVFLNPDYLTRVFKKDTGVSISDYLQQQRIEYAKQLLEQTEQSVSDIALSSGYSNLSYFSTMFKKATGIGPADYRRQRKLN